MIATLAAGRHKTCGAITIREIWDLLLRTKHVLHLNAKGQPIGESGVTFRRCVGIIMRLYYMRLLVPID